MEDPLGVRRNERETLEGALDWYRAVVERKVLESLSARKTPYGDHVSLRWILVHMVEETARHAGHMDLMRERIDGRTGD